MTQAFRATMRALDEPFGKCVIDEQEDEVGREGDTPKLGVSRADDQLRVAFVGRWCLDTTLPPNSADGDRQVWVARADGLYLMVQADQQPWAERVAQLALEKLP